MLMVSLITKLHIMIKKICCNVHLVDSVIASAEEPAYARIFDFYQGSLTCAKWPKTSLE